MKEASAQGKAVYLNLEHKYADHDLVARLAPYVTICQATTDEAQKGGDAYEVADVLIASGIETVIVTMASEGSLVATKKERIRIPALQVQLVDGSAAGVTFSAGFIYGWLQGWSLERCGRFATAAAALQCTVGGPKAFPVEDMDRMALQVIPIQAG
jgi:sugar/nucleoside kinase (ribokinase family)